MKKLHELGQNFLTDSSVAAKIAAAAGIQAGEEVWEIGPGMGILTREILAYQPELTAFELDRRLIPVLGNMFRDQLRLMHADILKVDWDELTQNAPIKLLSNLPYQITSPLLALLEKHHQSFSIIVLMLQKEVGRRLAAEAGNKAYGALTLRMRMIFDIETLLEVPAELFDPVPKVDSVVLRFTHRASPPALKNPEMFYRLIQLGFASRRKTLRNNLKSHFSAEQLQALEEQSGISLSRRAESLNEAEFITLADLL